jgi:uncharacterized repeat protein (TIGR03803 family)
MRHYVVAAYWIAALSVTGCSQSAAPYVSEQFSSRAVGGTTAYTETVLHRFHSSPDGASPEAGVVLDAAGNIFGTTVSGGAHPGCPHGYGTGCGSIYTIDAAGTERVIYSFAGRPDASEPFAALLSKDGAFYGTTAVGGDYSPCYVYGGLGCGTIFKIDRHGAEHVLYDFEGNFGSGKTDGRSPQSALVADAAGNLYGTTTYGGSYDEDDGTIFELSKAGVEKVLYAFQGRSDGAHPYSGVIRDGAGNLYGVAYSGGLSGCGGAGGCGTVFELSPSGSLTTLYSFTGKKDGGNPLGGMVMDAAGNLYGTTQAYGNVNCNKKGGNPGCGTVFKLTMQRKLKVLHVFEGDPDGAVPSENLIMDAEGNLYGTTSFGGDNKCNGGYSCGTVFEVDVHDHESVLHTFTGGKDDGEVPYGPVTRDAAGDLYGTTVSGGTGPCERGCGIVFRLSP